MIRFMTPDLPRPSGGTSVIYSLVRHLVDLGHDARVWHGTPGLHYPDHDAVPVDTGLHLPFAAGDLLVMPETGGGRWSFLNGPAPVVMLCQGMDFVFADASYTAEVPGAYPGWPQAVAAVAVSEAIATFLERACAPGFPVHHVPVEISPLFRPREKERRVAFMPRRRHADLIGAVQLMRRSGRMNGWELSVVDGMTRSEVADELGRCAIFLFGAEREGFGLPGAEAMAAGCHVVGFTGDGAKEYLLPDSCDVVPDSDVVAMADLALAAMERFDTDRAGFDARVERGRARVAERYNAERVRAALAAAFDPLTAPGSPALLPEPMTLTHYQAHAPRWGQAGAAYRGARHATRLLLDRAATARTRRRS